MIAIQMQKSEKESQNDRKNRIRAWNSLSLDRNSVFMCTYSGFVQMM